MSSQTQSITSASSAQANNFPLGIGSIYPSGYSVAPAPQYPLVQSSTQPMVTPGVHRKKMSLPTFSGQRKDWPEFKTVWKQLAEGAIKNKTALAHELKRLVKGEASQRIGSSQCMSLNQRPMVLCGKSWRTTMMIPVPLFKQH